jgi:hypothetical protein
VRRRLPIASAVLLLLCVATIGLWVPSYFVSDRIAYNSDDLNTYRCRESGYNLTANASGICPE